MGAGQSVSNQGERIGLHILRVTPSSPASQTNLEPFFDFIVGFEAETQSGSREDVALDPREFENIVEAHEGAALVLLVWSSKTQTLRHENIIPSRAWSQPSGMGRQDTDSSTQAQPSLLGLSMRLCEPETSLDNVWHVMDVLEGSPAESAGLVPYGDWIVGWSGGVLAAENDFYDLVEAHQDKPLRVYVYSIDFDTLREVVLVPNRQWGGDGLLGCVFGFGLLHRIPLISREIAGAEVVDVPTGKTFIPADQQDFFDYTQAHLRSPPPRIDSLRKTDDRVVPPRLEPSPHYLDPPLPR